jgi:hypothetical protein
MKNPVEKFKEIDERHKVVVMTLQFIDATKLRLDAVN